MSVELNPSILELDESSGLYSLYMQLYQAFFDSQELKSEENPFGIEEGDENSIRLRNTAYTFANAMYVAAATGGDGGGGGEGGTVVPDGMYLKRSGDDMTGSLTANYGLRAGISNSEAFRIVQKTIDGVARSVLSITGKLEVSSDNLLIDGVNVLAYQDGDLTLNGNIVKIKNSLIVGSAEDGLQVSSENLKYKNGDIFYAGNSNSSSVDWAMQNGSVSGDLDVSGTASLEDGASISGDLSVKHEGVEIFGVRGEYASVNGWLSLTKGIQTGEKGVLEINGANIKIGAAGGYMALGNESTLHIRLSASLSDSDGTHVIIDKNGTGSFQNGLSAKHAFGNTVFQTYRTNASNEGVVFPKNIRLGSSSGISISGSGATMTITTPVTASVSVKTMWSAEESVSYYKPQNQVSYAVNANTDALLFAFKKAIEATNYIGIDGTSTRLTQNTLFFKDNSQLISVTGGIKHYGDSYMLGNVSSESYASGFSGYGWAILKNLTTGSYAATFDELTIRKKMRAYELEVQKISATNGSLWVSNSCSGDTVIKL